MKTDRDQEVAMLEFVVKPKIQEARECLKAGKTEELAVIIARDIVALMDTYGKSERQKYENEPDNLKTAPRVARMAENAEMLGRAVDMLWDRKGSLVRPIDESVLDEVESIVDDVLNS